MGVPWGSHGKLIRVPDISICFLHLVLGASQRVHRESYTFLTTPMSVPLTFKPTKDPCLSASIPRVRASSIERKLLTPQGGSPGLCNSPHSLCRLPGVHVPTFTSLPCLLILCRIFNSFSYIRVFLPVSNLLLGKIIPHIDVFFIFSWGKVSSTFFYFTILISKAVFLLSNSLVSKSLSLFLFL